MMTADLGMVTLRCVAAMMLAAGVAPAAAEILPLGAGGSVELDSAGRVTEMRLPGRGAEKLATPVAVALLEGPGGRLAPSKLEITSGALSLEFPEGSRVDFAVELEPRVTLFRLTAAELKTSATGLRMMRLPMPAGAEREGTLNAALMPEAALAVMAGSPEVVIPEYENSASSVDLPGVSHTFTQTTQSREGRFAARFSAESTTAAAGWAMQGITLPQQAHKMKEIAGVAAWVHGDGKGEQLKFQLLDEKGGARDYYLPINFEGWREVVLDHAALDISQGERLGSLYLYYNGLPPQAGVSCLVDDVRLLLAGGDAGSTHTAPLEGFEEGDSAWWTTDRPMLELQWDFAYVRPGDAMGVIACGRDELFEAIREFEEGAGMLVPRPGGVWNKEAPAAHENYLFLTQFGEAQFDEALALARRGGFKRVLLGQESWCQSTGHFGVNRSHFPDGLPGLVRTVERFRQEGIDVGLHVLGASIDNTDSYLTPVPDGRLVKDAHTTLTEGLDVETTTIRVADMPPGFPAEDGGYMGHGTVLQIGDELIRYGAKSAAGFSGCQRGYLGTRAAAHGAGEAVHHLARSYGYHMFDMDTSLLDEVTSHFAEVANACRVGMVYFDGSESLQGPHGRYNARLINAYLGKLDNPNILVQASSFSHFSWHQLARSASADGHGDLKGYLEQRAGVFEGFARKGMPLDVGWYYGYDPMATPDQYEYILGTTVGYGASFSYQVSVPAAKAHPFTGEILNLIRRYDELRRSGRVPEGVKRLLRVPAGLVGRAPEDKGRPTAERRDYRLVKEDGRDVLQRVIYGVWHEWQPDGATTGPQTATLEWTDTLTTGLVAVGWQVHRMAPEGGAAATAGAAGAAGAGAEAGLMEPRLEIDGWALPMAGALAPGQYLLAWPGEKARVFGPGADNVTTSAETVPVVRLAEGSHKVRFTGVEAKGGAPGRVRVRTVWVAPERHVLP